MPGSAGRPRSRADVRHACSPWRAASRVGGLLLWPFRGLGSICSSWIPCSSGCAWGAGGCSRCPWSAASASRSGSSTWSRPGTTQGPPELQFFATIIWTVPRFLRRNCFIFNPYWRFGRNIYVKIKCFFSPTWSLQKKGPGWRRQTWHMESSR